MPANFGPTIGQRLTPSIERTQQLMDMILQIMRVAVPGVVRSFDPGPPATVSVQVAMNEYVQQNDGADAVELRTKAVPLPVLHDVPVLIPSGGGYSVTFPIAVGDECLLVFCDTALDVWLENGGTDNNPITQRRHSLSDAVAIFGLRSNPRGLSGFLAGYSTDSMQIRNDDATVVIDLASTKVEITAPRVTVNCSNEVVIASATGGVTIGTPTTIDHIPFLAHVHPYDHGLTGGPE